MVIVRRSILYLFFMTLFFPVVGSAVVPSYLDTSFNSPYGFAIWGTPMTSGERPNRVAIQEDGKIVIVDTTGENDGDPQIAVIRLNPDGTPDAGFNIEGRILYDSTYFSFATDVAFQRDENDVKIVVAGFRSPKARNWFDLILLRYNSDGTLDTSFNGGEVVFPNHVSFDGVNTIASLAMQNDGKILVATHDTIPGSDSRRLLLLRFEQNGTLDQSFGIEGVVEYSEYVYGDPDAGGFSTANITGRTVKIAPDGSSIVVLVKVFAFTAILKFDMNGILDPAFESLPFLGLPTFSGDFTGAIPRGMEVQQDGKIVVVGEAGTSPFVLRYSSDGNFDPTFGEGSGVVYFNYKDHFGYYDGAVRSSNARSVAIRSDGSIVLVGSCPIDHNGDMFSDDMDLFLARYASNGTPFTDFGTNGVVTFDGGWRDNVTYSGDIGEAIAVQPDGKVVVVGSIMAYDDPDRADPLLSHNDMVVIRFGDQPNPEPPDLEVSPVNYDYGEVQNGSTKAQEFSLSNVGQSQLSVIAIELIGSDNAHFTVDPGTCRNLTPTLISGESCRITVRFAPESQGLKEAILRITSNGPYARAASYFGPAEVSLQGTGKAVQLSYKLTVSTDGSGAGIVQSRPQGIKCGMDWSDCNEVYVEGKEITLHPIVEEEESRFVGWSGACFGRRECKVTMDSDKEVKATFMANPTIVVWPKQRDFRKVRTGRMKAAFFFVRNSTKNGRIPLTIDPIEPLASPYQIFFDGCSGKSLNPREDCILGVVFEPEEVGAFSSIIRIRSNDPVSPEMAVQLIGSGVAPPPPKSPRNK